MRWARPPRSPSCRPTMSPARPPRPASTAPSPATRPWPSACSTAPARPDLKLVFCSYPITPASALLHHLAKLRGMGVTTFQAEDEIAAACAAIGASYAGSLGVTASSGPGIALKTEAIGLAVATELPLVIVNAQRGGPSTGLPTKTEQSDLYQAVYGRNGDTPIVVLAAATPSDCFAMAREAVRIAVHHMTPGHAADRRLPRQLLRALADPRRRRDAGLPGPLPHRPRRLPPVPARRAPGPPLGQARHARPRAPHRRHREGLRQRQHLLRPRQPPAHDRRPLGQGAARSPTTSRCRPARTALRAPRSPSSAGAAPTGRSRAPSPTPGRAAWTSPTSTCATSGPCPATSATCCAASRASSCPR